MKNILVTGGTSYIGKHCIAELLKKEYNVRTTVRDIKKAESARTDINKYLKKDTNIEFFEADLLKEKGWNKAIVDCDAIMHVAGPYPLNFDGPEEDQIKPHEEGTIRILKLAKLNNVDRVVLTSSIAAVWMGVPGDKDLDESKWTNENTKHIDPYIKSKTIKEKAAWDYVLKNKSTDSQKNVVIANSGMAISTAQQISLSDGLFKAKESIESGNALNTFETLKKLS